MKGKKLELYRKRFVRLNPSTSTFSPRSKASKLLKCFSQKENESTRRVKRTLTFHYALVDQIKHKKQHKQTKLSEIAVGAILRKYKFRKQTQTELGIYRERVIKSKRKCITCYEVEQIKKFYERSDVSRITTGVRSTVTKGKCKHQKDS